MVLRRHILASVSDFLYTYILIILLAGAGVYFTIRTRFAQFRIFPEALRVPGEKKRDGKDISSFQARFFLFFAPKSRKMSISRSAERDEGAATSKYPHKK